MSKELIIRNRDNVDEIGYTRDEKQSEHNDLEKKKLWKPIFNRDDNVTKESGRYGGLKDWGFWLSKN